MYKLRPNENYRSSFGLQEIFETIKTELIRSGPVTHVGGGSESPTHIKGGYSIHAEDSKIPGVIVTGFW